MHLAHDERNGHDEMLNKYIYVKTLVSGTVHVTNMSMEKEAVLFRPPLFIEHPSPLFQWSIEQKELSWCSTSDANL